MLIAQQRKEERVQDRVEAFSEKSTCKMVHHQLEVPNVAWIEG